MGLLLDTHVLLWWLADAPDLPDGVKERLDLDPDVHVSAVTVWEISLKQALGKLTGPSDLPEIAERAGFRPLPRHVQARHRRRSTSTPAPRSFRSHVGRAGAQRGTDAGDP